MSKEKKDPLAGLYSSKSGDWNTPDSGLAPVRQFVGSAGIGFDPCSNATSIVNAAVEWSITRGQDGLTRSWRNLGTGYANFPYGRGPAPLWSAKIVEEARAGVEVVVLVPARTDTKWCHLLLDSAAAACWKKGRIKFFHAKKPEAKSPPFPSLYLYFGRRVARFVTVFSSVGKAVRL